MVSRRSFIPCWLLPLSVILPAGCGWRTPLGELEGVDGGVAVPPPPRLEPQPLRQQAVRLAVSRWHVCAIRSGGARTAAGEPAPGRVHCWGSNLYGQVGVARKVQQVERPEAVPGIEDAVAVAPGEHHTCVLHADGRVSCWGRRDGGRIGDGVDEPRDPYQAAPPTRLSDLREVVALEADGTHTCALRADGVVLCWGSDPVGLLGGAGFELRSRPTAVAGWPAAVRVSLGPTHTCAVTAGGEVVCAGDDLTLPPGPTSGPTRFQVHGLGPVEAMCGAASHLCSRDRQGRVSCAGRGYLGDGVIHHGSRPVPVTGLDRVVALDCGGSETCAVREGGSVHCWGHDGQTDRGPTGRARPLVMGGISDVTGVAVGGGVTSDRVACVQRAQGEVMCWGRNSEGQLGDGTTMFRLGPVSVVGLPAP